MLIDEQMITWMINEINKLVIFHESYFLCSIGFFSKYMLYFPFFFFMQLDFFFFFAIRYAKK